MKTLSIVDYYPGFNYPVSRISLKNEQGKAEVVNYTFLKSEDYVFDDEEEASIEQLLAITHRIKFDQETFDKLKEVQGAFPVKSQTYAPCCGYAYYIDYHVFMEKG